MAVPSHVTSTLALWNSPDGLFSLCLSNFGLLVPLRHDVGEGSTSDGSLELGGSASALLGDLLGLTLLVLSPVQNRPADLPRIALHQMRLLALSVDELEGLQKTPNHCSAPSSEKVALLRRRNVGGD